MKQNKFSEIIFTEDDICGLLMQGKDVATLKNIQTDTAIDLTKVAELIDNLPQFQVNHEQDITVEEYDAACQQNWLMPREYKDLDIAGYVLGLCKTEAELQRVGEELLLYQERGLFDLLKYMKYLVDTMRTNNLIWGVGRGSSVASYVLYLLGVHRIDSLYYQLEISEFLR